MKTYATATCALVLFVLAAIALTPQPGYAAGPWYVATNGNDSNSCASAVTPCASIEGAISKASAGDTIYVATGVYTGTDTEVVLVNKNVILSGGWDSSFTAQNSMSTIDGQGIMRGVEVESGRTVAIERFTIQNGFHDSQGGGIRNSGGTLTLTDSIIRDNVSNHMGGGISNMGTMTINNTSISGNSAGDARYSGGGGGGGISNWNGTLTLNSSLNEIDQVLHF